jgi:hypothetical protein
MSKKDPDYHAFIGSWILDPASCQYQQGDPPKAGSYRIEEEGEQLSFAMQWIDSAGENHEARFSGPYDGTKVSFAGGDLADELCIEVVSERELNSEAYYRGKRRMVAQRQLDETLTAMRISQVVFLPDGSHLANVSLYRKAIVVAPN